MTAWTTEPGQLRHPHWPHRWWPLLDSHCWGRHPGCLPSPPSSSHTGPSNSGARSEQPHAVLHRPFQPLRFCFLVEFKNKPAECPVPDGSAVIDDLSPCNMEPLLVSEGRLENTRSLDMSKTVSAVCCCPPSPVGPPARSLELGARRSAG